MRVIKWGTISSLHTLYRPANWEKDLFSENKTKKTESSRLLSHLTVRPLTEEQLKLIAGAWLASIKHGE